MKGISSLTFRERRNCRWFSKIATSNYSQLVEFRSNCGIYYMRSGFIMDCKVRNYFIRKHTFWLINSFLLVFEECSFIDFWNCSTKSISMKLVYFGKRGRNQILDKPLDGFILSTLLMIDLEINYEENILRIKRMFRLDQLYDQSLL